MKTMPRTITISRSVKLPDPLKLARYLKVPELGPRILFFSGGTALKRVSKELIDYTHNSIHIITPFDSGGSSAKIRDAFDMLSVGDLRNRLMALADQSIKGNPGIYRLFAYRLPKTGDNRILFQRLNHFAAGNDSLMDQITNPMKDIICNHIYYFLRHIPEGFNLQGASIGNIILAGGYLNNNKNIDTVLYLFSRLVEVRGLVKPVITAPMHLVAQLRDGTRLVGQHKLSAKESEPVHSPVERLFLTRSNGDNGNRGKTPEQGNVEIEDDVRSLIEKAELIVYPMGSFYSSVISNLLPGGVGEAVAVNYCPKIYIPNTAADPEQIGMTLFDAVNVLVKYLSKDGSRTLSDLLNFVLIDSVNARYPYDLELYKIRDLGVDIIDTQLVTGESYPYINPRLLIETLLSLT